MSKHLALMTEDEREECVGMWVDTPKGRGVLVDHMSMHGYYEAVVFMPSTGNLFDGTWNWDKLEILPHLPRAWEFDGAPSIGAVPAARKRQLLSFVHGEDSQYQWAVYDGDTPVIRHMRRDDAWAHFKKLVERKERASDPDWCWLT